MHPDYSDITSRLGKPLWWYDRGAAIPRYDSFRPDMCGIYDHVAALCIIRCQCCHMEFPVSVEFDRMGQIQRGPEGTHVFREIMFPNAEDPGDFDAWGDPPRHCHMEGTCAAGDTMSSEFVRIVEFWIRDEDRSHETFMEFVRHPEYELDYSAQLEADS